MLSLRSFLLAAISATPFLGGLFLPTVLTAAAPTEYVVPTVEVQVACGPGTELVDTDGDGLGDTCIPVDPNLMYSPYAYTPYMPKDAFPI